jgi:hypothetical protein
MSATDPHRRRTDQGARRIIESLPERFYRDVWLFVISVLLLVTVAAGRAESTQRGADNRQRIADIQRSRVESLRIQCKATNDRHDHALRLLQRLPISKRGQLVTSALINVMIPAHKDCTAYAKRLVTPPPVPTK